MSFLLDKHFDKIKDLQKGECWYIVKQDTEFWKQCYYAKVLLKYIKEESEEKLEDFFSNEIRKINEENPDLRLSTTHRALRVAYFYGLLKYKDITRGNNYINSEETEVYKKILESTDGFFEKKELYKDIKLEQIEKIYMSSVLDEESDRVRASFDIFPVIFLYKILLELGISTEKYEITEDEYKYIVTVQKKYSDYLDALVLIKETREIENPFERFREFKDKLDNRFNLVIEQLPTIKVEGKYYKLNLEYLDRIKILIKKFEENDFKENYLNFLTKPLNLFQERAKINNDKNSPYQKIVYGAPGTGKSYSLNQEAKNIFKREILLEKSSDEISTRKYWVVTCGEGNWAFEEFKRQGIYSIGWEEIKNISKLTYAQLEKEAIEKYNNKFGATQLNNIAHEMKIGDILLVRKGVKNKEIVGYGVISQEQYEEEIKDNTGKKLSDFYHNIRVDWKKFSPTKLEGYPKYFQRITTYKANPELIKEFEKICPQETPSKFETKEVSTIERVTFYDGYTYGQFVGMYKPVTLDNGDISYKYVPGPFMKQLVLAYKNSKDKFCLLIEEINRAKADKVFGNIFQLLDRNRKGESEYPISLSEEQYKYLKENLEEEEDILERIENEGLYLPDNLYIWATMNSADDGVQPLDTAFKRRWKFNYISLNANKDKFENGETFIIGKCEDKNILWNEFRTILNDILKINITEDRLIAPFFISPNDFEEIEPNIKIIDKNIFTEKVLMYIFDDLLRHYPKLRKEIFHNDIKTFSDIYEKVTESENFLKLIFNEGFLNQILDSEGTDGEKLS
ncbi:AAA family ATPase [Fusobacterium sp.]|uniref:AAA family ATPase n=1 Tax=Fusobacterium sp. TaxID=68766 RepID=UPI000C70910D|nr:AAA family ATPase [Fusobacterium sp.]